MNVSFSALPATHITPETKAKLPAHTAVSSNVAVFTINVKDDNGNVISGALPHPFYITVNGTEKTKLYLIDDATGDVLDAAATCASPSRVVSVSTKTVTFGVCHLSDFFTADFCVPVSDEQACSDAGAQCGTITNNCGVSVRCGSCSYGSVCNVITNRCDMGGVGDPIFIGFYQQRFSYNGYPGKFYHVYSDPFLYMNAYFAKARPYSDSLGTVMSIISVVTQQHYYY